MSSASTIDSVAEAPQTKRYAHAHWKQHFSQDEMDELMRIRPWRSVFDVTLNWVWVAGIFAMVAVWPNVFTVLLAICLLGARQLGCAVLMHEAAHRGFFENRKLNDWVGNWLCAYPAWSGEVDIYRRYHNLHHAHTGGKKDPDLSLVLPFPCTRRSLWRKIWRDLSGQTGWKQAKLTLTRDLGLDQRSSQRTRGLRPGQKPDVGWHKLAPPIASNAVLFGACWAAGHPAVYLLWPIAWLTTYRLLLRVRSIAEHALGDLTDDPFRNTCTTRTSWWERIFIAPIHINYHLEHHLVMTMPHYNLPRFHELLKQKGLLEDAVISPSYFAVLRDVSNKPAAGAAAAA